MTGASIPDIATGDIERYHAAALHLAEEARRIVRPALERGLDVMTKADASLVTDVDHAVERRRRELIGRWFPGHGSSVIDHPALDLRVSVCCRCSSAPRPADRVAGCGRQRPRPSRRRRRRGAHWCRTVPSGRK